MLNSHTMHWTAVGLYLWCHVCSAKKKQTTNKFHWTKWKVSLCFKIYHTKVNFWIRLPYNIGQKPFQEM